MAVALSRVTPAVVQRLQVPVQVLVYAGLFVCAQYLVNWLHLPLPANLVGMLMLLVITLRLQKGHFTADKHFGFEGAAWYWHFVDVVWLGLYVLVYWM